MDPWTVVLLVALTVTAKGQNKDSTHDPKLVCYYSNWAVYRPGLAKFTPENINPHLCTHIIYAFASLSEKFELQAFDPYNDIEQGNYRSFVHLKSHNPGLKTLLAVGGWNEGSRRFSQLVETEEKRSIFVNSALSFLREHGFDGLDLDWEYPAFREGGNQTTDKKGYALLIKDLRQAIEKEASIKSKEKLLLSVAVPATKEYIDGGFDVPQISRHADFLNLLTYDYHSAYETQAQHHAPLLPSLRLEPQDEENKLNVAWTVDYYLSQGAPRSKLVVGVPLYGRSYTLSIPQLAHDYGAPTEAPGEEGTATREKGYLAFYEICQKVKDDNWDVEAPSPDRVGPFAYRENQWVGFDDEEMLQNKARYILDQGLGGAMIWTLDNDDFRGLCTGEPSPLVGAIRDVLLGSNLIAGSASRRSVARSAEGPQERSSEPLLHFDDEASSLEEEVAEPPRRRNTLRRLVQNRQAARNRQAAGRRLNTSAEDNNLVTLATTPAHPPTPDPGVMAFECSDEGFFNNPRDCRKYFWCLDSGPANLGVVAHAFTCPSGLHFNSGSESCDYPENVVCPVGSTGASPAKVTPRPRSRATTTTTTTTSEPPTTTTEGSAVTEEQNEESPTQAIPNAGENVAELLRLLQAIGGVERLQSILGAQDQTSRNPEVTPRPLLHNVTSHRTIPETPPRPAEHEIPKRRPQHDASAYVDSFEYVLPDTFSDKDDLNDDEEEALDDIRFPYNIPSRGTTIKPEVIYVKESEDAPLQPEPVTIPSTPSKGPYRTPIRVQVGRVVRVQNGTLGNSTSETGSGGRRRMLVRVRPVGSNRLTNDTSRPTTEAPQVTSHAVGGDERKLSESTLQVSRANPITTTSGRAGETRVTIRRRPVYNDRVTKETRAGIGLRLVSRHPTTMNDVVNDPGNYVTIQRRPTMSEVTVSFTTTTTTTSPEPHGYDPSNNVTLNAAYEYDDEYDYDEYEDETTTSASTTSTTTTTRIPNTRPSLSNRRKPVKESPRPTMSSSVTSAPRTTSRRGFSFPSTTTSRPASKLDENDEGPPVEVLSDSEILCHRRGVFIHPSECSKFVLCAPISRNEPKLKGRVLNCPANQVYLVDIGRCMKGNQNQCQKL